MGHIDDGYQQEQRSLRRCPFCGYQAGFVQITDATDSGGWVKPGWTVNCDDEECFGGGSVQTWPDWKAAARAWNRRHY
jgi:hypothetical protein